MKEKLLAKKADALAEIELYDDLAERARIKAQIIDEMLSELEEEEAAEEKAADPVEETPNNLY